MSFQILLLENNIQVVKASRFAHGMRVTIVNTMLGEWVHSLNFISNHTYPGLLRGMLMCYYSGLGIGHIGIPSFSWCTTGMEVELEENTT